MCYTSGKVLAAWEQLRVKSVLGALAGDGSYLSCHLDSL